MSSSKTKTSDKGDRPPRGLGPGGWLPFALVVLAVGVVIAGSMRRTSPTFDEIVFVAAGARGLATGEFDLAPDHPPLMQYIYGLPVWLSGVHLPNETGVENATRQQPGYRYRYAEVFFFANGNDPERVAFLGRLPAVLIALSLVTVVFSYVRRYWGPGAGLLAAVLVGFLPDVLAHGGVAYNDVPVALALFGAAWAVDAALRTSSYRLAIVAGALAGLAVCVKISAGILLPLALGLAALEFAGRRINAREDPSASSVTGWARRLAPMLLLASSAAYFVIVLVYRGDFLLEEFRYGLSYRLVHMTGGHGAAAFLLGATSPTGWWYFFPIAFLFKTSAGLHLLLLIAALALAATFFRAPAAAYRSRLRMPVLGVLVFGAALVSSNLNIGFRYALPVLPLLCVVTAAGIKQLWPHASRFVRIMIVLATAWAALYPLSYYPHFLPFISEYGPGRDRGNEVLLDSSLDWGQGLLELRDFMHENGIPRVYLSYFGSGWPAGYGIDYVPMSSFFHLPQVAATGRNPEYVVISATNLQGLYLAGDPFARFREAKPDTVLAHTLFVYHLPQEGD